MTLKLTNDNIALIQEKFATLFGLLDFYFGCVVPDGVDSIFYCGPQILFDCYNGGLFILTDYSKIHIPLGSEISYIPEIDTFLSAPEIYAPPNEKGFKTFGELVEKLFFEKELISITCGKKSAQYRIVIDYWNISTFHAHNTLVVQ